MEAIILAGGLGTRLRSEVQDLPKPMAEIQSKPFLEYLLDHLISEGIDRIIFSVGYKSEYIQNHFSDNYKGLEIDYAIEKERLGTGGAIINALQFVRQEDVFVLNGDSIFLGDMKRQFKVHEKSNADVTFALKPMENIERYGTVEMSDKGRITQFFEKQPVDSGYVNVGVYLFSVQCLMNQHLPTKFSIENDFFESKVNDLFFMGYPSDGYFLDIGIPDDFQKAQYEIGIFPKIDQSWTLFLDRDGVINKKRDNDYVKNLEELELLPGAIEAIALLSHFFGKVIIVTNQQGVGKGLMTIGDVQKIHDVIRNKVETHGGKIDAFYCAPQLKSENSPMRKPNIGMAQKAKEDFPEIDFSKSIMLGDSKSDMEFGERANMKTVLVGAKQPDINRYSVPSVHNFQRIIRSILKPG
jgi:D-glycero-alpha-D-manno-heptose 1-phosphate guanylyltransferase